MIIIPIAFTILMVAALFDVVCLKFLYSTSFKKADEEEPVDNKKEPMEPVNSCMWRKAQTIFDK
jgi:hypothetical protein